MQPDFPGESLLLVDGRGVITYMSEGAAQVLKVSPKNAKGRRLTEVFPETRLLEVLTSRQVIRQEQSVGRQKTFIHYCPICQEEQLLAVAVFWRLGLTSENPQEENKRLNTLVSLYENIFEDLPIGVAIIDRQGRVVMMNREYRESLGISRASMRGVAFAQLVPFSKIREVINQEKEVLETEVNYRGSRFFLAEVPLYDGNKCIGALSKILSRERLEKHHVKEFLDRFQLLESKLLFYKEELQELRRLSAPLEEMIGDTPEMRKIKQVAARVALHDANVLITGESGTGKGLLAQAIHNLSHRNNEPFIKINCAAIPEHLLESELFGYEEGAFTGAVKGGKPGKFELADGGTIFLDEIGDMPAAMQAKILRVLQEKSFERVGGRKTINVNVRVIGAINRDLRKAIDEGEFRLDLYYRLAVINLHIPPLRERKEDIPKLTESIIAKLNHKYALTVKGLAPEVLTLLKEYDWPGNVRELENVLEYAFNFLEPGEDIITVSQLPVVLSKNVPAPHFQPGSQTHHEVDPHGDTRGGQGGIQPYEQNSVHPGGQRENNSLGQNHVVCMPLEDAVAQAEIAAILQALKVSQGNKQAAARLLGIHVSGLYQKLKKYNIG